MKCFCKTNQSSEKLLETVDFFKASSDENRLKIICFLKHGEKCVCDIVDFLGIPQNLVSHHLKVLRDKNILLTRKEGLKVFYRIDETKISKILTFLTHIL